jgi:ureidoacrylate peracid hydrolase
MARAFDISRSALLLIDTQRDLLHDDGALARAGMRDVGSEEVVPLVDSWNRLAADMSRAGRPVIWLTTSFRRDYTDVATADQWIDRRKDIDGGFLVEGSWGAELMDGLEPAESDYFIGKKGHGAFVGTHLDRLLTNLGVDQCVVAGGSVDDSILETVRTAGILGYQTFLVADAVYPARSDGLALLRKQTERTSIEEVASQAATAPTPTPPPNLGEGPMERTAFLIVDMQNDFLAQDRPSVRFGDSAAYPEEKRQRIIRNAGELAAATRARGWPVVYVRVVRRADNLDDVHGKTARPTRSLPEGVTHAAQGTWGAEIVDELAPEPNDFMVEKKGASGFGLTGLHRLLRNLDVRRCVVAGGASTGCVHATVFDGLALGYDITVAADATYPPDSPHLGVLAEWCRVRPTRELIEELTHGQVGVRSVVA